MTSSFLLFECISGSRYRGRNESLQTRAPIATLLRTASEPHAVAEYARPAGDRRGTPSSGRAFRTTEDLAPGAAEEQTA
jgi:hypothetical protein